MASDIRPNASLRWMYFEQYGSEVLCLRDDSRPLVFGTVYRAIGAARRLGGCALARCLHAPMHWVLLRPVEVTDD
ncbi:MAG TPA: hypothetical protein VFI92_15930 [Steroidobacteraceae bacterium]|nr:hypothetical protein [Steroidobacteraceae bacterium]